jgi:glyoxylase-like metal-dependent hydrolase (beta-lactamase superfamily II)
MVVLARRGVIPPDIAGQSQGICAISAGRPVMRPSRSSGPGPQVRIIEHQAHAPGHAALLIEERGVLVAGDMLSDVLIPMLDLNGTADWLPGVHARQLQLLARRSERDGTPG